RWTGVSLQRLLPDLRLKPSASHLKMNAADGFFAEVPIETIKADERVMLTYAWDGVPLLREHGFPLRIYIPNVCGMKQPKWITAIEAIDHWEPGYWVMRGWDKEAVMKATSVIDVVGMDMNIIEADQRKMVVPIGGIAHTGARGVSKEGLQVDNGPWEPTLLRTPLSALTWPSGAMTGPSNMGTTPLPCAVGTARAYRRSSHRPRPSRMGQQGYTARHRCFRRRPRTASHVLN